MNQVKYILIASNGKGVGKSTFANSLAKKLKDLNFNVEQVNFADGVRTDVFNIIAEHTDVTVEWLQNNYHTIKDTKLVYSEKLNANFVLRTLINKYSLFLSEFFPTNVWAEKYYSTVKTKIVDNNNNIIISDDLRRMEEMKFIQDKEDTLTIYLSKEDVEAPEEKSFEGLLNPKDFDLRFEFTENWSNSNNILLLTLEKLGLLGK